MMKPLILIVDDNPSNLMVLQFMLEDFDLTCDSALGGNEALEKMTRQSYDLLLLDWMMPGMDGLQVLDQVRSSPEMNATPVVLCTARETSADQQEALNRGATAFISKPISKHSLGEILKKLGFLT